MTDMTTPSPGQIRRQENYLAARLNAADANNDGYLSRDEWHMFPIELAVQNHISPIRQNIFDANQAAIAANPPVAHGALYRAPLPVVDLKNSAVVPDTALFDRAKFTEILAKEHGLSWAAVTQIID